MKMREIMDVVDFADMDADDAWKFIKMIDRSGANHTPETLYAQYGDPVGDLTADLKVIKLQAEIDRLRAQATKDVASVRRDT